MGVLVDELLQLARLGEGRRPEHVPVDLAHVVADAVGDAHVAAPDREIDLTMPTNGDLAGEDDASDGDGLPATTQVIGDDHQLHQVMANLLGNVLRHTPASTPAHVHLSEDAGWAILEVADEGPGLPPGDPAKLFEPFYRADPSRARETGGTGLGLAIVAAIVQDHGGEVSAASRSGGGAAFTVRLPLASTLVVQRPADPDDSKTAEPPEQAEGPTTPRA
jgi:two-component system, OmpR family, sensor kinase